MNIKEKKAMTLYYKPIGKLIKVFIPVMFCAVSIVTSPPPPPPVDGITSPTILYEEIKNE